MGEGAGYASACSQPEESTGTIGVGTHAILNNPIKTADVNDEVSGERSYEMRMRMTSLFYPVFRKEKRPRQ